MRNQDTFKNLYTKLSTNILVCNLTSQPISFAGEKTFEHGIISKPKSPITILPVEYQNGSKFEPLVGKNGLLSSRLIYNKLEKTLKNVQKQHSLNVLIITRSKLGFELSRNLPIGNPTDNSFLGIAATVVKSFTPGTDKVLMYNSHFYLSDSIISANTATGFWHKDSSIGCPLKVTQKNSLNYTNYYGD